MKQVELKGSNGARIREISDYTAYTPKGYAISSYTQSDDGDRLETNYTVTTPNSTQFDISEMKKGASYDYVQNCYNQPTENWSGTVIGLDSAGRKICKTNLGKYVTQYIVGIYIDKTAIIMRTSSESSSLLDDEVTRIFSSMQAVNK